MWIWIIVAVVVLGGLYLIMNKPATNNTMEPTPTDSTTTDTSLPAKSPASMMESTVVLSEQNDSGENGTVSLKEVGGKVMVSVSMTGAPATAQPAHIHTGSCPKPGAVTYPLTNVVDGMSETTLDVTLAELKTQMPLAVNVHKSAAESGVYVACGDLSL